MVRAAFRRKNEKSGRRRNVVRLAYLVMSLVPTVAVIALLAYVARAVSVRVVWRGAADRPSEESLRWHEADPARVNDRRAA
jgi:hypothetical protein